MSYPRAIAIMAQNLITPTAASPGLHENGFDMLWNGILNHHFPIALQYGVAPRSSITGTGSKPGFLVVKATHAEEDIVLVVELRGPAEESEGGRENLETELVDHVKERIGNTKYPIIFAVGSTV
jgi:hypothetical protein